MAYHPTRELVKATVLIGMPALLIGSYWRRLPRYSWGWWSLLVVLGGLLVGYGFMLQGLPEKVAVKEIVQQGDVYLADGQYDKAIETYRELGRYQKQDKMERKIKEALIQKGYAADYEKALALVKEHRYNEAQRILRTIPRQAVIYSHASDLLKDIEKRGQGPGKRV